MISLIVGIVIIVINDIFLYKLGKYHGKKQEQTRILGLCNQVFESRMSGSVRRVMNGIFENKTKLMSEDEFFGPDYDNRTIQL
jgi:hypothetical protein